MDYRKILWGILFIFFGVVVVLRNTGVLNFDWRQLWNLWPVFIIIWGVSLLPIKGMVKLLLSLSIVALAVLLVSKYDTNTRYNERPWHRFHRNDSDWSEGNGNNEDEQNDREFSEQHLQIPYTPDVTRAKLRFEAAAGTFRVNDTTSTLIEFRNKGNFGTYSLTSEETGEMHLVKLKLNEKSVSGHNIKHAVDVKLHNKPLWDFDLDIGAAKVEMDLSKYHVNRVDIDGGASSILLRLGNLHSETNVEIDAGASSIEIEVPENSGCRVKTSSVLSGKTLKGFTRLEDNVYETEGFLSSSHKINIRVDAAVSKIEVKRY